MAPYPISYYRHRDMWWYESTTHPTDHCVLMIGTYHLEGGCGWEFAIDEQDLQGKTLRVKIFSDAWDAFIDAPAFFVGLAELGDGATLEEVIELMQTLGWEDRTKETRS